MCLVYYFNEKRVLRRRLHMNTLPRFLFANRHGGILYNGLPCPRLAMILNKDDEEKELLIVKWAEARREAGMWRHYFVVSYEKGGKVVTSTSIGLYNADPPVDLGHGYVLT